MRNRLLVLILCLVFSTSKLSSQDQINNDSNPAFCGLKTAKIIVKQSFEEADKVSLPYNDIMVRFLQYAGIKLDTLNYDMTVNIEIKGYPIAELYVGNLNGMSYSGASLKGSVILEAKSGETFAEQVDEVINPPKNISSIKLPNNAPFMDVFKKTWSTLLKSLYIPLGITPIINALKDQDYDIRRSAVEALGRIKDGRAIEPLLIAMKDQSSYVYSAAAESLASLKDTSSIEPLIIILANQSKDIREIAAETLEKIDPSWRKTKAALNSVPKLIAELNNKNFEIRGAAAEALGNIEDRRAIEPLIIALKDQNRDVRELAIHAIKNLKDIRAVESIVLLLNDEDNHIRQVAARTLGSLNDSRAIVPLIFSLKDQNYDVRDAAAEAAELLNNFDPSWRKTQAAKNAVPTLIYALKDQWKGQIGISTRAANLLGCIKDNQAVEPLIIALKSEKEELTEAAAIALGNINDNQAVEPLIFTLSNNRNNNVIRASAEALGKLKDIRALESLINALKIKDNNTRGVIVNALISIDPSWRNTEASKNAIPKLIESLKVQNDYVREISEFALEEITHEYYFHGDYSKWKEWWEKNK
jgi:HEAT repeat protein